MLILSLISVLVIVVLCLHVFSAREEYTWQQDIEIESIWTSAFPKLMTESAFRLVDCNQDGILDIIFGYGTSVDSLESDPMVCDLYFNGVKPCNGGVKVCSQCILYRKWFYRCFLNSRHWMVVMV